MLNFIFGIENEAEIYCSSTKRSISKNLSSSVLDTYANYFREHNIMEMPVDQLICYLVIWAEDYVRQYGWDLLDEDGVSWALGVLIEGIIEASEGRHNFDNLFKPAFIKYFQTH